MTHSGFYKRLFNVQQSIKLSEVEVTHTERKRVPGTQSRVS